MLRLDARRNREKILLAARLAFLESGPDASLEEIARRASVGIATLYRRFPTREALIREVVVLTKQELLAEARQAQADQPRAWDALAQFLRRVAIRRLGSLLPVLGGRVEPDQVFYDVRDALIATVRDLIERAQADGDLRSDVGFGDVQVMTNLLSRGCRRHPDR
ncbi:TetR/AcrR family transcriptional regulator [Micromonospora zhanjiangensis]